MKFDIFDTVSLKFVEGEYLRRSKDNAILKIIGETNGKYTEYMDFKEYADYLPVFYIEKDGKKYRDGDLWMSNSGEKCIINIKEEGIAWRCFDFLGVELDELKEHLGSILLLKV